MTTSPHMSGPAPGRRALAGIAAAVFLSAAALAAVALALHAGAHLLAEWSRHAG